jgi:hypothetical protein
MPDNALRTDAERENQPNFRSLSESPDPAQRSSPGDPPSTIVNSIHKNSC